MLTIAIYLALITEGIYLVICYSEKLWQTSETVPEKGFIWKIALAKAHNVLLLV